MKEGHCLFCDDLLPADAKGSFCDEMCKDLQSRTIYTKKAPKAKDPLGAAPLQKAGDDEKPKSQVELPPD